MTDYDAFCDQMLCCEINAGSYGPDISPTMQCLLKVMPDQYGNFSLSSVDIARLEIFGQIIPPSEIGPTLREAIAGHAVEFGEWKS